MDKIFKLNQENLEKELKLIHKENPDIEIHLTKSPNQTSNSYYIRFIYKEQSCSLRISDHFTKLTAAGGGINNLTIGKRTKISYIRISLQKVIETLRYKTTLVTLDKIANREPKLNSCKNQDKDYIIIE